MEDRHFSLPRPPQATRLDRALVDLLPGYSRSFVQQLIAQGMVWVNGAPVTKASWALTQETAISIIMKERPEVASPLPLGSTLPESLLPTIILEHDHFVVINKPAGLLVHAALASPGEPTVVDWLRQAVPAAACVGNQDRPGIIHRLDKDTSGVMVIVKDPRAHAWFGMLFKDRKISKVYQAIVQGSPPRQGVIDYKIMRHPTKRTKLVHSYQYGKEALTRYQIIQQGAEAALMELYPATGRTHQLRVHCAAIGHPIIGDRLYHTSSPVIARQALHAMRLSFEYEGVAYTCEALLPVDMQQALLRLM